MKKLIITTCNECSNFDDGIYGARCFHHKITNPHPEGVVPKTLTRNRGSYVVKIPKWCPLEDYKKEE